METQILTVFGKITVIKTMCLPKFTHIAAVIPSLSLKRINKIEREFELFLKENNPYVTDKITRYIAKKKNGLGMIKINHVWRSVRMLWLRRLTSTETRNPTFHIQPYNIYIE